MSASCDLLNEYHDSRVYGFLIDTDAESFKSNLILDIDFISEFSCNNTFKVVQGLILFYNVTDLKINIDWGDSKYVNSRDGIYIINISKVKVERNINKNDYFKYNVLFNDSDFFVSFGSSGHEFKKIGPARISNVQYIRNGRKSIMMFVEDNSESD